MNNRQQFTLRLQNILFVVLFLTVIGLLAWLGKTYHQSFDFTASQQNSLSPTTQQLLTRLDKPLSLVAYVPDDATVHSGLKKLVNKYRRYKPDIKLQFINPDLNPEQAKADGIQYSGQLLIKLGDRHETVNTVDEQVMLNTLQRLARDKPRLAIFIEGHGERSPLTDKSNGISQFADVMQKQGFRFQPHNLLRSQSIPDATSLLVIAAPQKDYLEGEVKLVLDYLKQGGNLLWLHDPGDLHGLDDLEQALGLLIHEGTLLDANQALQDMLGIKHPAVIPIVDYGQSSLTKDLGAHTLFPFATAVFRDEEAKNKDWRYQPFLTTLPTSWLESGDLQGNVKFDDEADIPGPLDIGMQLTRPAKQTPAPTHKPEQRVVVMGDSDFLVNGFIGQGSNLELASNLFNWLGEDDTLLSIKAVRAPDTTLALDGWALYGSALFFLILLPLVLLLVGTIRWLRRRKR